MKRIRLGVFFLGFVGFLLFFTVNQNPYETESCRSPSTEISTVGPQCRTTALKPALETIANRATLSALKSELRNMGPSGIWSRESLYPVYKSAISEQLHWNSFVTFGLKETERIYWLQQRDLKALNEEIWNLPGAEHFLAVMDLELTNLINANPELGRIIHRNYKDRVIVSSLSPDDFNERLVKPLKNKVTQKFLETRFDIDLLNPREKDFWSAWIDNNLKTTHSRNLIDAHLQQKGQTLLSFPNWKTAILDLFEKLKTKAKDRNQLLEILEKMRKTKGDVEKAQAVSREYNLDKTTQEMFLTFNERMQVADFLPISAQTPYREEIQLGVFFNPPGAPDPKPARSEESWLIQRQLFLTRTLKNARYIIALDRKSFGALALKARIEWLENGATPGDLPNIYLGISAELSKNYELLLTKIQEIIGQKVEISFYKSGDDALVSIPEIDLFKKAQIENLLQEVGSTYHSFVTEIPKSDDRLHDVATAIFNARQDLFALP
jgi:hypothetical protein